MSEKMVLCVNKSVESVACDLLQCKIILKFERFLFKSFAIQNICLIFAAPKDKNVRNIKYETLPVFKHFVNNVRLFKLQ